PTERDTRPGTLRAPVSDAVRQSRPGCLGIVFDLRRPSNVSNWFRLPGAATVLPARRAVATSERVGSVAINAAILTAGRRAHGASRACLAPDLPTIGQRWGYVATLHQGRWSPCYHVATP